MSNSNHRTALLVVLCGSAAVAQCPNGAWTPQFQTPAMGLALANGNASASDCMAVFDPDGPGPLPAELYVGGPFATAGGLTSPRLAKWNGHAWSVVGVGITGRIQGLAVFDFDGAGPQLPKLVAAGQQFSVPAAGVANAGVWDGTSWTPMGDGLSSVYVNGFVEFDPDGPGPQAKTLVMAGNVDANAAAIWNGQSWARLGELADVFRSVAVFDEDGDGPGLPTVFGSVTYEPGLYKWTGSTWEVGAGGLHFRSGVIIGAALKTVDEDGPGPGRPVLLAGGFFGLAGTLPVRGVARWTGSEWLTMGSFSMYQVEAFEVVDYTWGQGAPTIYAYAVSEPYSNIIRWQPGTEDWVSIGELTPSFSPGVVRRMGVFAERGPGTPPSLYVGGMLSSVNQTPTAGLARFVCAPCYPNCDWSAGSPILTANDFVCFLNRFATGSSYANCDGSTGVPILTGNDFVCFINTYAAGCF